MFVILWTLPSVTVGGTYDKVGSSSLLKDISVRHRKCPGIYFAQSALFINIAMSLHVFDITPALDEEGHVIVIEPKPVGSFIA